jgi:hypothetical protein
LAFAIARCVDLLLQFARRLAADHFFNGNSQRIGNPGQ